nr:hypothetical protein [Paenibacillus xerothermodurans]
MLKKVKKTFGLLTVMALFAAVAGCGGANSQASNDVAAASGSQAKLAKISLFSAKVLDDASDAGHGLDPQSSAYSDVEHA